MAGIDSFTSLMLHCNGTDGSTSFVDSSQYAHTVTAQAQAQVDTAQSQFGGASALFDGSNDRLDIPDNDTAFNFGSGDWTIDFWAKKAALGATTHLVGQWEGGNNKMISTRIINTNVFDMEYRTAGGSNLTATSTFTLTDTNWHHYAIVRDGNTLRFFVDGVAKGTADWTGVTLNNASRVWHVSSFSDGSQAMNGHIDEVRISKGIARWTAGFTPETAEYSADPIITPTNLTLASSVESPTIIIDTTVTPSVLDIVSSLENPQDVSAAQIVEVTEVDIVSSVESPAFQSDVNFTPTVLDLVSSIESPIIPQDMTVTPSVVDMASSLENPTVDIVIIPSFATKIIHINPLIFVTNSNPAEIVQVDISDPENPVHDIHTLTGASFAKDVIYNSNTGFIYVACDNGIVVKVELADLDNQELIDLSDSDQVTKIEVLSAFGITYAATDSSSGEVYLIDESEVVQLNTEFHFIVPKQVVLDTEFHFISAVKLNSEFYFLSQETVILNTEFYFLPDTQPAPLKRSNAHIFVDNVELTDIDLVLSSIEFDENIDNEERTLSFTLTRKHDDLDHDLDGNFCVITNQNVVRVDVDGHGTLFEGKISTLTPTYNVSTDQVDVFAISEGVEFDYSLIELPIASIDEQLSLYHVLFESPTIENIPVEENSNDPAFFKGIRVNLGDITKQSVLRFNSFEEGTSLADDIVSGLFNEKQNWTYFWFVRAGLLRPEVAAETTEPNDGGNDLQDGFLPEINFPVNEFPDFDFSQAAPQFSDFLTVQAIQRYVGTSLSGLGSDLWNLISASFKYQRIQDDIVEPGIILDEFKSEGESSFELSDTPTGGYNSIEEVFVNGEAKKRDEYSFSGNSVTIVGGTNSGDRVQIRYGTNDYFVGEAPFDTISVRNGKLVTKERWSDKTDGFYREKDDSFDFIPYAKTIADLEYQKILNINGSIAPRTSCQIGMALDAYYFYNLKLLKRINVGNTTELNEYRNNNGFPVSIKAIHISLSDMKVTLQCDNSKSNKELEDIDGLAPDEESDDYNFEGYSIKQHTKFDLVSKSDTE